MYLKNPIEFFDGLAVGDFKILVLVLRLPKGQKFSSSIIPIIATRILIENDLTCGSSVNLIVMLNSVSNSREKIAYVRFQDLQI